MVDYANNVRPNPGGLKVGGHQASSSSLVTVMTYLFFEYMCAGDRISVKPHASPVYHAIQFMLGNLKPEDLHTLRSFGGLQAYPSRSKDPDGVDFSTGSVGLGVVAPNFSALTEEFVRSHYCQDSGLGRRNISVVGDAELDEGSVWEAIGEPFLRDTKNVLWVVDLNRQSLDRVIPGIRVSAWREMFSANGWQVVDAKYGKLLQAAFEEPNGELLRIAIDGMSNEIYQRLLRVEPSVLRQWLLANSQFSGDMKKLIERWDDNQLQELFRNLGGHDFGMLREAFGQLELESGPSVLFAYTLKGWRLPSVGDPQNHSVNLTRDQMEELRIKLGIDENSIKNRSGSDSEMGKFCSATYDRLNLNQTLKEPSDSLYIPSSFGRNYSGNMSTQQIFGMVLTDVSRNLPELAERVVSVSPDVASSTNLGGWINRVGVWTKFDQKQLPEEQIKRALNWIESPNGQHIELGISENNLFMCLGQLGLSHEMNGEMIFPIGTLYDPFIRRGLDALMYSVYCGGKFIVVATPSGVTLGPEGATHQSIVTPSIGVALPKLAYYEPCFGQELEWILLSAMDKIRLREESTYLRLTSKKVDQGLFKIPSDPGELELLRLQAISGAYKLVDRSQEPEYGKEWNVVNIMSSGAMVPEAVEASNLLLEEGVFANVINVTGPGVLYERFQSSVQILMETGRRADPFMEDVIPIGERAAPIVTVIDGHPQTLAWLGSAMRTETIPLGVSSYGQSGNPDELYREYRIDTLSIVSACFGALGL